MLNVLIVDDEALARTRLRTLLGDCPQPPLGTVAEADSAAQALHMLQTQAFDVLLLDIHMPGSTGLALAEALRQQAPPPQIIFVTAHAEHALQAFELSALDYLTKPVRRERLQQALEKAERQTAYSRAAPAVADAGPEQWLTMHERGRTLRVPVAEVLYFKAELKYVTVRTADASHVLDGSLNQLEERHGQQFLRVHRNALVARHAIRTLERLPDEDEGWGVRLAGVDELVPVSRRHVTTVRELLSRGAA